MKLYTHVLLKIGNKVLYNKSNKVLWSGKAALLDMLFNNEQIKIDKIVVGDGGVEWGASGEALQTNFVENTFPDSGQVCLNKVGEASLLSVTGEQGSSEEGWTKGFSAIIYSQTDINDSLFNVNNIYKKINNISVVCSGVAGYSIEGFGNGEDIPFSNITFPSYEFHSGVNENMYLNWSYRVI